MELTAQERAVLAHVVIDPEAWTAHALSALGEAAGTVAVRAKVEKYQAEYEEVRARQGEEYKTRAVREAEATSEDQALRTTADLLTCAQPLHKK